MENLIEGLQREMNRVREMITVYESIPKGAGIMGAMFMRESIKIAEVAIANGDTVDMMRAYTNLQEYKD